MGITWGTILGLIQRDTRSLESSSSVYIYNIYGMWREGFITLLCQTPRQSMNILGLGLGV